MWPVDIVATNDFEEPAPPTFAENLQRFVGGSVAVVTDTGPATVPLRIWLLLVIIGACCTTAPLPVNVIGVIGSIALALSVVPRRRSPDATRP